MKGQIPIIILYTVRKRDFLRELFEGVDYVDNGE